MNSGLQGPLFLLRSSDEAALVVNFQPLLGHNVLGAEFVSDLRIDGAFSLDPIAAAAAVAISARQEVPVTLLLDGQRSIPITRGAKVIVPGADRCGCASRQYIERQKQNKREI